MKITKLVPWLVEAAGTYWGEYFFVEVRTDEGVTGWGKITTTTKIANRAVAGIIRELNELLVGEDPSQIERLWHKTFRSFTYTGSRGATTNVISGIDIALWDIRGKVRDDILLYTHPNSGNFGTDDGVVKEIRAIVDSGHTALKVRSVPPSQPDRCRRRHPSGRRCEQARRKIAASLTARIRKIAGPDVEILIDAHGRFNVPTATASSRGQPGADDCRPSVCAEASRMQARSIGSSSRCRSRVITRCIRCESCCTHAGKLCRYWRTTSPIT